MSKERKQFVAFVRDLRLVMVGLMIGCAMATNLCLSDVWPLNHAASDLQVRARAVIYSMYCRMQCQHALE
jgi:hypothetical protein